MICPSCKENKALIITERIGIEIDYCTECRGVWLDRGELNKIIKRAQSDLLQENIYKKEKEDFSHKRNKSLLEELFG
jgi:Zn-finger nucleic acid-binding protein